MTVKSQPIRILIAHSGIEGSPEERQSFLSQCFNDMPDTLKKYNATLLMSGYSTFSFGARASVPQHQYDALVSALSAQNYLVQRTPVI